MPQFKINGRTVNADVPPDTPLLWVVREELSLLGTKFGCGKGLCGACTVHLEGEPTRACILPVAAVEGKAVSTIESLSDGRGGLHPVQQAWMALNVTQCGYCQSGQLMTEAAFPKLKPHRECGDPTVSCSCKNRNQTCFPSYVKRCVIFKLELASDALSQSPSLGPL